MPKLYQRLVLILKTPSTAMFGISLGLLIFNLIFIAHYRPFNSDDVYWQQAVRTWHPFSGQTLYLGATDTFTGKAPFFYLFEGLFSASRNLAIVETILLTSFAFTSVYIFTIYILKKLKVTISFVTFLPFVWLASFGYPIVDNYLNVNWRTADMGVSFLTFLGIAAITFGDFKPMKSPLTKLSSLLIAIILGVFIASDPYFMYFTVAPIILFSLLAFFYKKLSVKILLEILGITFIGLIASKLIDFSLNKAGIVILTSPASTFVNFNDILTNIIASLHGLLIIFGADFFGLPISHLTTLGYMLNAIVLGLIIYAATNYLKLHLSQEATNMNLAQHWKGFFGIVLATIFLIYTSSTLVTVTNYRFFMLFVYCAVALLAIGLTTLQKRKTYILVAIILVGATIFNLCNTTLNRANSVLSRPGVLGNVQNSFNYGVIAAVKAQGLQKGYANYWQGNINTYLSKDSVLFLSTICDGGKTVPFRWNIDGSLYNRNVSESFYLYDPDISAPPTCTIDQLASQFGKPIKTIQYSNKTVLVYDYDIGTKLGLAWHP